MSKFKKLLHKVAHNVEGTFDKLSQRMDTKLGLLNKIQVVLYNSYASESMIYIRGRVLEAKNIAPATDQDSIWKNLLRTYQRLETDEIPNVLLKMTFRGVSKEVRSDEEGYFDLPFKLDEPLKYQPSRYSFDVEILDFPVNVEIDVAPIRGEIYLPPEHAEFGVISDVDDTIMKTDVISLLKMAKATFLQNSRTRIAFKGVSKFYQALQAGKNKDNANPFFYVSSSPWNLFDLIRDFIDINEIPAGPILLRDLGIDKSKFIVGTHGSHKRNEIEGILKVFPHLNFILIGDSGEQDPFIYYNIAKDFPGRILAIYIRDAKSPKQQAAEELVEKAREKEGIEMYIVPNSLEAAKHAVSKGYMTADAFPEIETEIVEELKNDDELDEALEEGEISEEIVEEVEEKKKD